MREEIKLLNENKHTLYDAIIEEKDLIIKAYEKKLGYDKNNKLKITKIENSFDKYLVLYRWIFLGWLLGIFTIILVV